MSAPKPVVHRPLRFIEPPEKDTYKSYLDRIAVIHCVGSPRHYSLTNIQDALISAKVPSDVVEGMAPFRKGQKWQIRMDTVENRDLLLASIKSLEIRTPVGVLACPLSSFYDDVKTIRVSGLGLWAPVDVIHEALADYGEVKLIVQEKLRGTFDVYSGQYLVTMKVDSEEKLMDIPDTIKFDLDGEPIELSFTVFGIPPRCHRCGVRGHVRSECTTRCQECGSGEHPTERHPSVAEEILEPTPAEATQLRIQEAERRQADRELRRQEAERQQAARAQKKADQDQKMAEKEAERVEAVRKTLEKEGIVDSQPIVSGQMSPQSHSQISSAPASPESPSDVNPLLNDTVESEMEVSEAGGSASSSYNRKRRDSDNDSDRLVFAPNGGKVGKPPKAPKT